MLVAVAWGSDHATAYIDDRIAVAAEHSLAAAVATVDSTTVPVVAAVSKVDAAVAADRVADLAAAAAA